MKREPFRVYIASPAYLQYEKWLGQDASFLVTESCGDGPQALREIRALPLDVLLLDGALQGMDALALLSALGKELPAPPRVLYLYRGPDAVWQSAARENGADEILSAASAPADVLFALRKAAAAPLPRLAKPWEKARLETAERLMGQLQMNPALKGWAYIRFAAACLACAPQLARSFSGSLYPLIGAEYGVSPFSVERAVRTAVENTFLQGSLNGIQALFGLSVDADKGKPTNAEFLSMLAEHVRRETARRMREENAAAIQSSDLLA